MGFLSSLLALDKSPTADFWYTPIGTVTKAGEVVDEDAAFRISAILQGVRFICQTVAGLPKFPYHHAADGRSREKDASHPLNTILRFRPNAWQTAFQFFEVMTAHAIMRGIGIAEKVFDEAGELEALQPLDPNKLLRTEQMLDGTLRYVFRRGNGSERVLMQDEVFALSGFGTDGFKGFNLVDKMRETAGLAIATENYGATFFSNSAMPRVVLTSPNAVRQDTRDRMKNDWRTSYGGDRKHGTALLEEGTKVEVLSTKNDEAQFIETRRFLIAEFSRHLDVTPHRLSDMEKSSFNNVEQMSRETVMYTLQPWVQRWEGALYRDLLTDDDKAAGYFIEFSLDGLLRGDTAARANFYQSGINSGWLTRNEVREKENLNPIEGLDAPLQAVNQVPVGETPPAPPATTDNSRAFAIAKASAERVISREVHAVKKWKERKVDGDEFKRQVIAFYRDHVDFVCHAMAISEVQAALWCDTRCDEALRGIESPSQDDDAVELAREALK